MSTLSSLSDEVLKLGMQHVPLKDRLTNCCLVNSRLHVAAVAATEMLELSFGPWQGGISPGHADSIFTWLSHYGQHLTRLSMDHCCKPLLQLPCPNLLELQLGGHECTVQLGPAADGNPGVIQSCTKLTRLEVWCDALDTDTTVINDGLMSLVHLQHLNVGPVLQAPGAEHPLIGDTLPSFQHLTYLEVHRLSIENLLQLGTLTNLQELRLSADDLSLNDIAVGPSSVPGLGLPTSLTRLGLLSPMEAGLLSLIPADLQDLSIEHGVHGPAVGPDSFLSGLARLQNLNRLYIDPYKNMHWPAPGPVYSALTASTGLISLEIIEPQFPKGVWQHVFPAKRILPHLNFISVPHKAEWGDRGPEFAWGAADVSGLVGCCPNLHMIEEIHLQHGMHVSQLHRLTALTYVNLIYDRDSVAAFEQSVKGLAGLSQIRHMRVELDSVELTVAGLLPLTKLTALTALYCEIPLDAGWQLALKCAQVSWR